MKKAVFSELKYGDILVSIDHNGDFRYYTYLCRDPNNKEAYAFLVGQDDYNTIRPYAPCIEKMFLHESYEKTKAYAEEIRAEYYRRWLQEHTKVNDYGQELSIPEHGDLIPLDEFNEAVSSGCIMDDDGHGNYATVTTIFRELDCFEKIPEELKGVITHVVWFNK